MTKRSLISLFGIAITLTAMTLAGSTRLVSTWRNPTGASISRAGEKVAAFVITAEESMRLGPEESLAGELRKRGVDCIAGYTVLPGDLVKDREEAKEFLARAGITGVIVMRVLGEEERKRMLIAGAVWYSGPNYPGFWSYWQESWTVAYAPAKSKPDKVYSIETVLFSLVDDKPIWAGTSETTNPKNIRELIEDVVEEAGKELRNAGLVPE
jgi:hypothetical protein